MGHGLLPTIFAGQIAAVPLGADVVQIAQHAAADRLDRVGVKNVVMPLVAGGQDQPGLLGHAGHVLALMGAVGHELLRNHVQAGPHGGDGRGGVQVQGQGDDDAFQAVALGLLNQFLVAARLVVVDIHVPAGLVFGLPAVFGHQAGPGREGRLARMVAVEGPPDVVRADVGNRADLDERRG